MSQTKDPNTELEKAFIQLVSDQTGLKLVKSDQENLKRFILRRSKYLGFSNLEIYYYLLRTRTDQSREEWESIVTEITNPESFFFRDKGQFKLLKEYLIPNLIQQKSRDKTLRICSAGCSTGQEPYSIAILLRELIPDLADWNLTILGVDINPISIEKARKGIYHRWSFRGLNEDVKQQFFQRSKDRYYLVENIKNLVDFRTVNLLKDSFSDSEIDIQNMDLIVCRNVFIYFDDMAVKHVLNKFHDALNLSGYLLTGHSELYNQDLSQFKIRMFDESTAYQRISAHSIYSMSEQFSTQSSFFLPPKLSMEAQDQESLKLLEKSDFHIQKIMLTLLKHLPADTRISRLGNLTASELISQYEKFNFIEVKQ
ncbi:MAG: methyltransferase domain-containing protein [Leptolyngbya sp. SIO1D8]|nr:methyltransferase domain-containing protein [Leptolyngbya sp. SIO1D8]